MEQTTTSANSPYCTIREAAVRLNVPVSWIRKLIARGDLSYKPEGKRFLLRRSEVEAYGESGWQKNELDDRKKN